MASGAVTYDSYIGRSGNRNVFTGTVEFGEAAETAVVFDTKTRILNAQFTCEDAAEGYAAVKLNQDKLGNAQNGSLSGIADGDGTILRYRIEAI
mgnify:CR=1 FL=1|tara:strand:- start:3678 stop:3959 length:282 start_codon:yes stop_codon:yes gene_type:complete